MLFIYLLLNTVYASAGEVCAPLSQLHSGINFCFDNPQYLPPANACKTAFSNLVKSKYPQVKKALSSLANDAKSAQHLELSAQEAVFRSTEATLSALIAKGNQVLGELNAYADDFVPPVPSWAAGHWKPNRRNPGEKARSLSYYCWAEPMKTMDQIIAETQKMVDELVATKVQTEALHFSTTGRNVNLENISDGPVAKNIRGPGGQNEHQESTITGEINRKGLAGAGKSGKVTAPGFKGSASSGKGGAGASEITSSNAEAAKGGSGSPAAGKGSKQAGKKGGANSSAGPSDLQLGHEQFANRLSRGGGAGQAAQRDSEEIEVAALLKGEKPADTIAKGSKGSDGPDAPLVGMIEEMHHQAAAGNSSPGKLELQGEQKVQDGKSPAEAVLSGPAELSANPSITLFDRVHRALRSRGGQLR
ncbi:MAG TPA: hypothetical protein VIH99_04265 [Bdellovibrionota bacterium]|jgi:hypothetical protein